MSCIIGLFTQVYSVLLRLYPSQFRTEFGDEMRFVFADMLAETTKRGIIALILTCLRELRDLPGAILREHLRQRRKSSMENKPRVSWLELLCAAIPFLLYLAFPLIQGLQLGAGSIVILFLLGMLFISMIVGMFKGLPRWSLPAFGLLLPILNYMMFGIMGVLFIAITATPPLFLREIFGSGFSYVGIIVLTLVIILTTAWIKPLRPFFQRIREDWTLLPFALFGIVPLAILISFDEYQGDVPYQIGIGLTLITSLWLYLRSIQPRRKMLILGVGITLAMAIEAIGKWILIPSQTWIDLLQIHPIEQAIQSEVTGTVYTWFWMMVILFFPALLGLLPQDKQIIPT